MIGRVRTWLRHHERIVAEATIISVAIIATFVAFLIVRNLAMVANSDRFVSDWEIASLSPPEPQDPDIVIVAVTEDTLSQFAYRSPVDRGFLANLLTTLASCHPRAIGVDFLFDQPTEPAKDALLKRTLRDLKVPLVVAYTDAPNVVDDRQLATLNTFVPLRLRGYATLAEDNLDVVRWVFPGAMAHDGRYIPGFARALAAKVGVRTLAKQIPIVWHGHPKSGAPAFREFPAHLVSILPASWFQNKIVLIGEDVSLTDRHRTPFDVINPVRMAGIVAQAHALSQLIHRRASPYAGSLMNLLIVFLCAMGGAQLGAMNISLPARMGAGAGFMVMLWLSGGALYYYGGYLIGLVTPTLSMALALWGTESLTGREARQQREFIQGAFSHYISPELVDQLVHEPDKMSLAGERRVMSYLFSDIANFTTMSEGLESGELGRLLNAYLDGVTKEILKVGGMVDKFIGDAVFAIFNAPLDLPDHAECAVKCALAIDKFAFAFSQEQNARGIPFGITRLGVHTGPAMIGNFGSSDRFNYTAQGDSVNVASRLEALNKHFHTRLCVSNATKELCPNIAFRPIAEVVLKGKHEAVEVWEPLHEDDPRASFMSRYIAAYEALKACDPEAGRMLAALAEEAPDDPCISLHMERLAAGETGVAIIMEEK